MTIDELVWLLNASQRQTLTELQELVLRSSWEGKTYSNMADETYYGAEHLRKTAQRLWQMLSDFWGEPITKTNFRPTLEPRRLSREHRQLIEKFCRRGTPSAFLEFPSGPLPLDSSLYISRPPIEELAYSEIAEPGSVIRIKAPRKMGKSSLMLRIIAYAGSLNYRTVSLDFQQADAAVFASLDKFLRWFSANVSRELQLESRLDDYWDEEIGSKVSCTIYFQGYLLAQIKTPVVLALNEVNRVFEYPEIAQDFLSLLRFWHEKAKQVEAWQKFRLIVAYSKEIYISLKLNQSPFNIGLPIKLPLFNLEQVQDLAQRYGLNWTAGTQAQRLLAMVGGHPYLLQLAFYRLYRGELKLERLLQEAATEAGIYNDHLRWHLAALQEEPELSDAFKQVIAAPESVKIEPILAYKLNSMGLVTLDGEGCRVSCELYRLYFQLQIQERENSCPCRIQHLERENQNLQELVTIDSLTQLANRRYFNSYLKEQWQQLAGEGAPLSVIFCDLDLFKTYNDTYGFRAGDNYLRQVAGAIGQIVNRSSDLVARYGGEEFAVILPQTDAGAAIEIAEKIRNRVKALEIPKVPNPMELQPVITVSLGVASTIPELGGNPATLVLSADEALDRSKKQGRDRVTISSILNVGLIKNEPF